ncbi:MAG: hypothetical protein FJZ00_09015 [Candidatus Sericytochromatia bacterium]|uniref:Uncharacterized protein n=1 Tax=Candidatus Tanganyikabacteria bacterium TaxID=2961651 RepID=A0A937X7Z7_9BACT|nr:hypothetical protein [Candidatus Tanganyikabacteria bacterium]
MRIGQLAPGGRSVGLRGGFEFDHAGLQAHEQVVIHQPDGFAIGCFRVRSALDACQRLIDQTQELDLEDERFAQS